MGAILEISYFNSIVLAGGRTASNEAPGKYHIEEARIEGEFNGKVMDYGVKAHITDQEYAQKVRKNAMTYSGIFNSRTNVNESNQFPSGEDITRAVDIAQGSIQKLHAEDTNLIIFQENKVNRALIDKDAIFTAEGQPLTASAKIVIGQITPYAGNFGISTHPESFTSYGNRKYFADKRRGAILRLSKDGITPISDAGMKDWFKDALKVCDTIYGAYDEQKGKYCLTLETKDPVNYPIENGINVNNVDVKDYATLCYDERSKGWTSFYTYKVRGGISLNNEFYTFQGNNLYLQHSESVPRGNFVGSATNYSSFVEFVFNDKPEIVKTFLTIGYEGTTGWNMQVFETGGNTISGYNAYNDINTCYVVPEEGTLVGLETIGFVQKEGFYFSELRNKARDFFQDSSNFNTTGVKGYFANVKMQYWHPNEGVSATKAELFSVGSEVIV
jgi:hypothetical protein